MIGTNISLSFNLEKIYEDANFTLGDKDKIGIVGVNGAGKTTLFKVILGEQHLDSGKITISDKRIGYLPQEIILRDKNISVYDYLMSARPIKKLEEKLQSLYEELAAASGKEQEKIMKKISSTQYLLEYYDIYNYENILLTLIDNMKISFIHFLYYKLEILLLDEPTNHIDINTKDLIIGYLKKYKVMVLIISHDV